MTLTSLKYNLQLVTNFRMYIDVKLLYYKHGCKNTVRSIHIRIYTLLRKPQRPKRTQMY